MNALIANEGNQTGILAVMPGVLPVSVAPALVANATLPGTGFLNLINVLMRADSLSKAPETPVVPKVNDASPKQIAAALIRSMIGLAKSDLVTDATASATETAQQKPKRDQRAPSEESVPVPPIALPTIAVPAPTTAPTTAVAVPAPPIALVPERGDPILQAATMQPALAETAAVEASSPTAPTIQDRAQTHAGTIPAGVMAQPAPATAAPQFELAFGAVLTRLDAEPAPAPVQPGPATAPDTAQPVPAPTLLKPVTPDASTEPAASPAPTRSPITADAPQPAPAIPERVAEKSAAQVTPRALAPPQVTPSLVTPAQPTIPQVTIPHVTIPQPTQGNQLPQTQRAPQPVQEKPPSPQALAEDKTRTASRDRENATEHVTAAAASTNSTPGHAADFTRLVNAGMGARGDTLMPQESVAPLSAGGAREAPGRTVADAIRGSEPVQPVAAPLPRGSSAQEFAVRIAQPNSPAVDLHVTERNGQVQVAVRTPDAGLQASLRQDLGTLVNSLERAGYHADTFVPHGAVTQASSGAKAGAPGDQQRDRQDSHTGSRGGSGESSGGRQQQPRQRSQNPQHWLEELEKQP